MYRLRKFGIWIALVVVVVVMIITVLSVRVGITEVVEGEELVLPAYDLATIPQSVADDAAIVARQLFGNSKEKYEDFVNQLLAVYSEARESDFVVIVNPGGWGAKPIRTNDGWWSILNGIQSELARSDYTTLWLYHRRTEVSLSSYLNEIGQMIGRYATKAKDLASRVEFVTRHIPELRVIIAAESNGTMISNSAMAILADNPQVYSILTGPPFWYKMVNTDRALIMTDNGMLPDAFSTGDIFDIFWGQVKYWFKLSPPVEDFGTPPHYFGAPGHDYWWQYPEVRSRIISFLEENFVVEVEEATS